MKTLSGAVLAAVVLTWGAGAASMEAEAVEKWRADLDVLLTEFFPKDLSFSEEERGEFVERIEALKEELPALEGPQVAVRIAQAVAVAGNAHTSTHLAAYGPTAARLPIRVWWFADGLYVVKARPEQEGLLGMRVTSIGGRPIDAVIERVCTMFYGNASWQQYNTVVHLVSPGVLYGLELIDDAQSVDFAFVDGEGMEHASRLEAEAPPEVVERERPWWALTPAKTMQDMKWRHALTVEELPSYLRNPNDVFWYEFLPEQKALYIHYNASARPEGLGVLKVRREIEAEAEKQDTKRIIFDLRFNTGGDYTLMRGLFEWLMDVERFKKPGALYVITGKATFSAGLFHAANMKQRGGVVVGELAGDDLDFWAEGGEVVLPNSHIVVFFNDGFHGYSMTPFPEHEEHLHTNLDIETLEPDVPLAMTFEEYVSGRDRVLEAALEGEGRP